MIKIRIRVIVGVMIFFGYFLIYVVRYSICAHIIDMAHVMSRKEMFMYSQYNASKNDITRTSVFGRLMDVYWDDMAVGSLFAAYHIGYCVCYPIFHSIGERLGPTYVVGIAGLTSGLLTCLTPSSVYLDYWALFVVRIIKGLCAGAMQPSMVQLLRHWVPPIERNHFVWAYCGVTTGTLSTFLLCAGVHYYSRWWLGFYVCGAIQIFWSAIWLTVVADTPEDHQCIPTDELAYLNNTITSVFTGKLSEHVTPWDLILKSKPFWAVCILNFGYAWLIISMCTYGPFYYTVVGGYTVYKACALTALPFFFRLFLGYMTIHMFYWYKYHAKVTGIENIRKYFIVVSHVIPGALVGLTWFCQIIPGPVLLTLAVALTAAGMDITLDLCYELTPTYVNSVTTLIKIIGNTSGIIVPFCVGAIIKRYKNWPIVWKHIWCFHATVLFLSGVIFLVWGEFKVQPWNNVRRYWYLLGDNTFEVGLVLKSIEIAIGNNSIYRPAAPRQLLPSVLSKIVEVDEEGGSSRVSASSQAGQSYIKRKAFLNFMTSKL